GSGDYPFDANKTFIQNIVLPNGTKWKFEYQANEGNVSKITLPTGGSISYAWQTFTASCSDSVRFAQHVVTRTVDPCDGTSTQTWNYQLAIPRAFCAPLPAKRVCPKIAARRTRRR